jgi:NTE family protein
MPFKLAAPRRRVAGLIPVLILYSSTLLFGQEQALVFHPQWGKPQGNPHYFIPHRELAHPRLGLALSGGGARCLAQIGVLQALEEENIPIDFIAGTSMGSFVGGMYAAGYSAKQLREIVKRIAWDDIMKDTPPRKNLLLSQKQEHEDLALLQIRFNGLKPDIPRALTAGQKLHSVLTELTWKANYWASGSFDNLRVPFRAIATDVYSGEEVVLESGDLSEALRASGALPLLIAPVPKQDMLLVDGGVANNIPVDIVRRFGMEIVIAVDATSNLRNKEHLASPWEFADQVTTIMQQEKNARQRGAADILISFEDLSRTSLDFTDLDALIQLGYERMRGQLPKLRALRNRQEAAAEPGYAIHVRTVRDGENVFTPAPACNGAGALTASEIQRRVDSLYASGDYQNVEARLARDTLTFILTRNPILRAVRLRGNTIYPDSILLACVKSRRGAHLNHHQGKAELTALIEHYRRDGYALAEIEHVQFDSAGGELTIAIDEGKVSHIELEGLRRTQALVVLREFALRPGEIFNSKRARQGIDNIHSTGLFENVGLTPLREAEGGVRLRIKVEEKAYNVVRVGDYYYSERGNFAFIEAGNDNVLGTGSKLFLHGGLGKRRQEARISWRSDRIFKTFLTLSASAYHRVQDDFVYDQQELDRTLGQYFERRGGVRLSVGQQVRGLGAVSAQLRWEEIRIGRLYGEGYPAGASRLTSFEANSVLDTRDRLPFPRGGRYLNLGYEYGNVSTPAPESFVKFAAHVETYHTLGPHTLLVKMLGGVSDRTTPFSEQFRLGGPRQILGLREQQLFGRQFVLGGFAYRYQLRKRPFFDTYVSARYEVSGLWNDQEEASYKRFHHAWGLSVSWDTPLGPVGLAFGTYENRQRRIYFNAGVPF